MLLLSLDQLQSFLVEAHGLCGITTLIIFAGFRLFDSNQPHIPIATPTVLLETHPFLLIVGTLSQSVLRQKAMSLDLFFPEAFFFF